MRFRIESADGQVEEVDRTAELVRSFMLHHIDACISAGGDGSMAIADALYRKGLRIVGVPKTIDNDLDQTVVTFGFETAVAFATECLDRLHSTASSHGRIMVVEVMGRYAGWIALHAGIAGSADVILIPEIRYDLASAVNKIKQRAQAGSNFHIVVVAEGARPKDGDFSFVECEPGRAARLGGVGQKVADELEERTGREARTVVLGHLLRGGSPTAGDRLIALRFGAAAVRALEEGRNGVMVALDPPDVRYVPFEAACRIKTVPLNGDTIMTGRDLGICFGD
jgi:6-phosphofructokinase 1